MRFSINRFLAVLCGPVYSRRIKFITIDYVRVLP